MPATWQGLADQSSKHTRRATTPATGLFLPNRTSWRRHPLELGQLGVLLVSLGGCLCLICASICATSKEYAPIHSGDLRAGDGQNYWGPIQLASNIDPQHM